jgi:hypothetical protein
LLNLKSAILELRGKRVNILNYGGSNDLALQLALKEGHEAVGCQVSSAAMRQPDGRAMSGRIDATILSPPHLTIVAKAGYRIRGYGRYERQLHPASLYVKGSPKEIVIASSASCAATLKDPRHQNRQGSTMKVFANRMYNDDLGNRAHDLRIFRAAILLPPRVNLTACATRSISTPSKIPISKTASRRSSSISR